jgi:hypothetical protein
MYLLLVEGMCAFESQQYAGSKLTTSKPAAVETGATAGVVFQEEFRTTSSGPAR